MNSIELAIGQQEPCSQVLERIHQLLHFNIVPKQTHAARDSPEKPPRQRATETWYRRDSTVFLQSLLPHEISLRSLVLEVSTEGSCVDNNWMLLVAEQQHGLRLQVGWQGGQQLVC